MGVEIQNLEVVVIQSGAKYFAQVECNLYNNGGSALAPLYTFVLQPGTDGINTRQTPYHSIFSSQPLQPGESRAISFSAEIDYNKSYLIDDEYIIEVVPTSTPNSNTNRYDIEQVTVPLTVYGCTDPQATNYNPEATTDDGTCLYNNPVNTGMKAYTTLQQYDTRTGTATGKTKPNTEGDPNYVAPSSDVSFCPIGE